MPAIKGRTRGAEWAAECCSLPAAGRHTQFRGLLCVWGFDFIWFDFFCQLIKSWSKWFPVMLQLPLEAGAALPGRALPGPPKPSIGGCALLRSWPLLWSYHGTGVPRQERRLVSASAEGWRKGAGTRQKLLSFRNRKPKKQMLIGSWFRFRYMGLAFFSFLVSISSIIHSELCILILCLYY